MTHKLFHSCLITLSDGNVSTVEILLSICLTLLNFACQNLILRTVDIVINGTLHFAVAEWGKESICNALFERILIYRISKVTICISIYLSSWCSSQTNLHSTVKILQYASPITLILCTSSVALVNDNQVEEVFWILTKETLVILSRHKCLEYGEEHRTICWNLSTLANRVGFYAHKRILLKTKESIERLISKGISVSKEEYAWPIACLGNIPLCLK